jgi:hypothetical protein
MYTCFGNIYKNEPLKNLDGRYYMYFVEDKLVAMTGLADDGEYYSMQVDWTCTLPEYRHKGYMQELFEVMLKDVKEDVYCSCWRLPCNDKVNLHTLMDLFGFEEVIHSKNHWKVPHNCTAINKKNCIDYTGECCECYEDLFLRKDKGKNYEI